MVTVENLGPLVRMTVFGEFTLADYKEFEELVNYKIKFQGKMSLLWDLRQMSGFTLDVAWEDIQFTRHHQNDFDKVAILATDQFTAWSGWLSQIFVKAKVKTFSEEDSALEWLDIKPRSAAERG